MNPQNSQDALSQLQQIQSQSQNPNDILSNQRQQLGVNSAQDTVTGLRGAINNTTKLLKQVAPSVMGRTGNSLVTSAQAGKIIQNEQAPISENLTEQGSQYTQAAEDLNRLQGQASESANGIYQGQQDKLSYAQNLYNTLYQREQATEQARQADLDRQEQIRQFNSQLSASAKGRSFDLRDDPPQTSNEDPVKQKAQTDVGNLLSKDSGRILREYTAIKKSAGYGNTYDQLKLQLIESLYPQVKSMGQGKPIPLKAAQPTVVARF